MKKLSIVLVSCSLFTMSLAMDSLEKSEPKTEEGKELKETYIREIRAWLAPEDPTNLALVGQRLDEFIAALEKESTTRKANQKSIENSDESTDSSIEIPFNSNYALYLTDNEDQAE